MNIHQVRTLLIGYALLITSYTQDSLIINGSFEETSVFRDGWRCFDASKVSGWTGSNVEVWYRLFDLTAADELWHIELNSYYRARLNTRAC